MNLFQEEIYRSHLAHGVEWKKHKYIRKEGNRYIYPEDLKGGITGAKQSIKDRASDTLAKIKKNIGKTIANQKQKSKDREFVKDYEKKSANAVNSGQAVSFNKAQQEKDTVKKYQDQIKSAHQVATKDTPRKTSDELKRQMMKTAARKMKAGVEANQSEVEKSANSASKRMKEKLAESEDRAKKQEAQIRAAHQGDTGRTKIEQYDENDPDFADKNYNHHNRVGNTDFYLAKRKDGTYVLLEEDMKWDLGKKPDGDLQKRLESFNNYLDDMHKAGYNYDWKQWNQWATQAINGVDFSKRKVERKNLKVDQNIYNYNAKQAEAERKKRSSKK